MSDNEKEPVQDQFEDEEVRQSSPLFFLISHANEQAQVDFSKLKKKKKSKKKVDFETEEQQEQPAETQEGKAIVYE